MFKKITAKVRTLYPALANRQGAIDLASIMVGVIVIGVIAGTIAATVFAVIPWSQDRAAASALDSVRTAQSVTLAQSSEAGAAEYQSMDQLVSAELLQASTTVDVVTDTAGTCYLATAVSASGSVFWSDSTSPTVTEGEPVSTCTTVALEAVKTTIITYSGNLSSDAADGTKVTVTVPMYSGPELGATTVSAVYTFTAASGGWTITDVFKLASTGNTVRGTQSYGTFPASVTQPALGYTTDFSAVTYEPGASTITADQNGR
jgi:hypothetical protein